MTDAIVIGAGLNGLVAANYLAKAGKRVLVLERRAVIGGQAATESFGDGFKVDALPQWLMEKSRAGIPLRNSETCPMCGLKLPAEAVSARPETLPQMLRRILVASSSRLL